MPGGGGGTTTASTGGQGGEVGGGGTMTASTGGQGGACNGSCADALPRGRALAVWASPSSTKPLRLRLRGPLCADACNFSLCVALALDVGCETCLQTTCTNQISDCNSH